MPRPPKKRPPGKPRRAKPPHGGPVRRRPRKPSAPATPRDAADGPPGDRLQKVLAAAGIASRRECEQLILEGRVQVDGNVVTELGTRVDRQRQEIRIDGEPLPRPRLQYFAVHKPAGVVSTTRDPAGRPRVIDLLPPGVGRMFNVGRLDLASEGLIIVTNDGLLANQLTHPSHGVEKIYEVQVAGEPAPDVLAQIKRGVHLSEGYVHAVDVRVKGRKKGSTLLEMVLDEGRNREIRRLLARLGHKVQRLTRIAVGPIRLGEMPRGAVRQLTPEEVRKLRTAAAEGPRPQKRAPSIPTPAPSQTPTASGRPAKPRRLNGKSADAARHKKKPAGAEQLPARRIIGEAGPAARTIDRKPQGGPPKRPMGGPKRPGGGKRPGGPRRPGGGPKRSGRS